ncbi:hypothetical protein PMAYCL1PPCAC_32452, partial [Pristionchus mayeri]
VAMSSSEELERHLRLHFDKLECSFIEEWAAAGGDLASLTSAQCFEAVVRLLWRIRPSLRSRISSFLLPPSATARFRMASVVAEAAKEVGVREQVEFQHLLYGSGKDLSSLFIALLQLVPVEGHEEAEEEDSSFHSAHLRRARLLIAEDDLWVPEFCRALKLKHDGRFWCPGENEPELFPHSLARPLSAVLESSRDPRELAAALYLEEHDVKEKKEQSEATASSAVSPSASRAKPALPPKPSLKPPPVEDESARLEREEAERELREAETALAESREMQAKIRSRRGRMAQERVVIEAELAAYDEKLMATLEDPVEARAKIEKFIDDREERAAKLETKWEKAREEKMEELRELREAVKSKSGHDSVHDRLRRARAEKERLATAREAYERRAEKLSRRVALINDEDAVNRHAYVRKLMEVTGNLKKQREELHKVWRETDMVLKDIKWAEQAATRTFDLLEDAFYKNVNRSVKDERLYKNFVTMYNKCQLIVKEAENVGASKKRKEELVDQVDQTKNSAFLSQLSPMLEDFASIEEENRRLEELLENA